MNDELLKDVLVMLKGILVDINNFLGCTNEHYRHQIYAAPVQPKVPSNSVRRKHMSFPQMKGEQISVYRRLKKGGNLWNVTFSRSITKDILAIGVNRCTYEDKGSFIRFYIGLFGEYQLRLSGSDNPNYVLSRKKVVNDLYKRLSIPNGEIKTNIKAYNYIFDIDKNFIAFDILKEAKI